MTAPSRLRWWWLALGLVLLGAATLAGVALGAAELPLAGVAAEILNLVPGITLESGLTARQSAIVTEIRLPRVVLALLVGAMLALAGGAYQGVFRNPLAEPFLLGVAAGAGLGVTVVIALQPATASGLPVTTPVAAFTGALGAVLVTYLLGAAGGRDRAPETLILAGVAVAAFLTAMQTYLLQRHVEVIREVYTWLLGRLGGATWGDVRMLLPYAVVSAVVIVLLGRELDVMSVGDHEASGLGINPQVIRIVLLAAASLGTAAAVSVSGLIGFVGIIVPHIVRLIFGTSYRVILPLSVVLGAAFLVLADLAARTVDIPREVPIGVITAFLGAPFFVIVLRATRRAAL
ncbi:iron ABC transporter permease [Hoyosella sp. YIM 151337]|uniref:FecCD family ABC transporter permease n=1 Tax=Hoyosella sp. YIM 151337 TaxID=2992742 RepID=UPI002235BC14|nr:iron ABC transporter permease [Hoyosella sp. YIM 151337]MCW4355020.1 iron ABC transporter permease [Hoyosella sp. YIM 151337]